jgi:5-methylthioadenosine/S-adenosylhomocysteine deaminase
MNAIGEQDIETLAIHGAHVVHCPRSNLKLASGISPVQRLLDHDINVALGTDGAASNNRLSMLAEAQTASLIG